MKTELLELFQQLSFKYFNCRWTNELEYILYLQLSGCRFESVISVSVNEENELRNLSQKVEGWFSWDETSAQPMFIGIGLWNSLYQEWHNNFIFRAKLKSNPTSETSQPTI